MGGDVGLGGMWGSLWGTKGQQVGLGGGCGEAYGVLWGAGEGCGAAYGALWGDVGHYGVAVGHSAAGQGGVRSSHVVSPGHAPHP